MSVRFKCKCGHSKAEHDRLKKDGWCCGDFKGSVCDCDGYEADQYRFKKEVR